MQQDKRTIKTERAIREAAMTLLKRKALADITVNDICEAALISRNTFYGHYADKYLLLETLSKSFIDGLIEQIIQKNVMNGYRDAIKTSAWLFFDYLNDRRDTVRLLAKNDPHFWQSFIDGVTDFMTAVSGNDDRTRVFVAYSSSALIGCYHDYFEGRIPLKAEDFVRYVIEISTQTNMFMQKQP